MTYDPDPADLALSSVPGQEMFDPRKRKFSAEELKPQPMIKKARKVFIPDDMKVSPAFARPRHWGAPVQTTHPLAQPFSHKSIFLHVSLKILDRRIFFLAKINIFFYFLHIFL